MLGSYFLLIVTVTSSCLVMPVSVLVFVFLEGIASGFWLIAFVLISFASLSGQLMHANRHFPMT